MWRTLGLMLLLIGFSQPSGACPTRSFAEVVGELESLVPPAANSATPELHARPYAQIKYLLERVEEYPCLRGNEDHFRVLLMGARMDPQPTSALSRLEALLFEIDLVHCPESTVGLDARIYTGFAYIDHLPLLGRERALDLFLQAQHLMEVKDEPELFRIRRLYALLGASIAAIQPPRDYYSKDLERVIPDRDGHREFTAAMRRCEGIVSLIAGEVGESHPLHTEAQLRIGRARWRWQQQLAHAENLAYKAKEIAAIQRYTDEEWVPVWEEEARERRERSNELLIIREVSERVEFYSGDGWSYYSYYRFDGSYIMANWD